MWPLPVPTEGVGASACACREHVPEAVFSGEADDVHERSKGRDFLNETERATLSHLRLDGTCSAIGQPGFKSQPCARWAP